MSCCDGQLYTALDVPEETIALKPVKLWHACALLGWFLDTLKVDPDRAMQHFGMPSQHPLRGCFEPQQPSSPFKESQQYESLVLAVCGSREMSGKGFLTQTWLWLSSTIFVLVCPTMVQLYCWTLLKDPCREFPGWRCQRFKYLENYGGAQLTSVFLIIILAIRVAAWLVYQVGKRLCRAKSMAIAQFVTIKLIDKVALQRLPNTVGIREKIVMWGVLALFSSFAALATIDMNAGILAFGNLVTIYLLLAGNAAFGNPPSLDMLRERHVLTVAERAANEVHLSYSAAELRMKVLEWYRTDPLFDAIIVDLPILVLLANLIWIPPNVFPESVRIRRFIIPQMFPSLSTDNIKADGRWMGYLMDYKDVVVDVFTRSCTIPDYDHSSSRWAVQGERLPWHFALKRSCLHETLDTLSKLGVVAGTSCFSPASSGILGWELNETGKRYNGEKQDALISMSKQEDLGRCMVGLLMSKEFDDEEAGVGLAMVKALLKAGANVNQPWKHGDRFEDHRPQALFQALRKKEGEELGKLLIKEGSNLKAKVFGANADMDVFERYAQLWEESGGADGISPERVKELKKYAASLEPVSFSSSEDATTHVE